MKDPQTMELEKLVAELRTMNRTLKDFATALISLLEIFESWKAASEALKKETSGHDSKVS